MKSLKTVLIVTLSMFVLVVNAEEKGDSELKLGYGILSSNQLTSVITDMLLYPASLGTVSTDNLNYSGSFYAEYNHAVTNRVSLGGTFVYERNTRDVYTGTGSNRSLYGEQLDNAYTMAVNGQFRYINGSAFKLYTGLGLGYTLVDQKLADDKSTDGTFAYNVTALGIQFGRRIGVHAELGFGYKGILSLGLNYKF